MKSILKMFIPIVVFIAASGATYVAYTKWNAVERPSSTSHRNDTIDGVKGLSEGETIALPALTTLNGEQINLANLKEERLLCVFISSRCSGCSMDAELWRNLEAESSKRGVAFYIVDIADSLDNLKRFSSTYKFEDLPILFDAKDEIGKRVEFLPQYILFTRTGEVIHRWDGVRRYDKKQGATELARFFQPH